MEGTLLMTGLTLGSILAFPLMMEWLQKFQVGLILTATLVVGVYCLSPYSNEARIITNALNQIPQTVLAAMDNTGDGLTRITTEYYHAFKG